VGAGVLLVDECGRVLLTLRKFPPEAECWSIIGGKVDFLETVERCAVREALEEVGLKIAIDGLLCITDHLLPEEGQHWVRLRIWGEYWKAKREIANPTRPGNTLVCVGRTSWQPHDDCEERHLGLRALH